MNTGPTGTTLYASVAVRAGPQPQKTNGSMTTNQLPSVCLLPGTTCHLGWMLPAGGNARTTCPACQIAAYSGAQLQTPVLMLQLPEQQSASWWQVTPPLNRQQ